MTTKTMTFKEALAWIAINDEPTILDAQEMEGFISVQLVADIYGKEASNVAALVVTVRQAILENKKVS